MPADPASAIKFLPKCPIHHRDCPPPAQASLLSLSESTDNNGGSELELCHPASCPLFLAAVIVIACTVHQTARWILLRGRGGGSAAVTDRAERDPGQSAGAALGRGYLARGRGGAGSENLKPGKRKAGKSRGRSLKQRLRSSCCQVRLSCRKRPPSAGGASVATSGSVGSTSTSTSTAAADTSGNAAGSAPAPAESVADAAAPPVPAVFSNSPRALPDGSEHRPNFDGIRQPDRRVPRVGYRKPILRRLLDRVGRFCSCSRRSRTRRGFERPRVAREVEVVDGGQRSRRGVGANDVTIIPFEGGGETGEAPRRYLRRAILGNSGSAREVMGRPGRGDDLVMDEKWDAAIELTLRRFVYSTAGGAVAALTLFRSPTTRWSAIAFGAGLGLGSALMDSSYILNESRPTGPFSSR